MNRIADRSCRGHVLTIVWGLRWLGPYKAFRPTDFLVELQAVSFASFSPEEFDCQEPQTHVTDGNYVVPNLAKKLHASILSNVLRQGMRYTPASFRLDVLGSAHLCGHVRQYQFPWLGKSPVSYFAVLHPTFNGSPVLPMRPTCHSKSGHERS